MSTLQSPMQRCNAVLRALGARYRLREHRRSPWITVYELGARGRTREHTVRGYAAADPLAVERLQDLLIEAARTGQALVLPDGQAAITAAPPAPCWPEICAAVVAFQRGQGVNMNLVGPFRGKGYFCLLPSDRPATAPCRSPRPCVSRPPRLAAAHPSASPTSGNPRTCCAGWVQPRRGTD